MVLGIKPDLRRWHRYSKDRMPEHYRAMVIKRKVEERYRSEAYKIAVLGGVGYPNRVYCDHGVEVDWEEAGSVISHWIYLDELGADRKRHTKESFDEAFID